MNRFGRFSWIAAIAVAAAACGDGGAEKALLSPDGGGPKLTVGPTASVTVACPSKMEQGTSASCLAFGYDASGYFTTHTATWSSSNTSIVTVSSSGGVTASYSNTGSATITATINGYSGSATVTVAGAVQAPTATIFGQSHVRSGFACDWYGSVTNGTAPYTYNWSVIGAPWSASGSTVTVTPSKAFTIYLTVTDADGRTSATVSKYVTVSSTGPYCA